MKNKGIYLISFLLLLLGCKKYPENTIWFKKKKNIDIFLGSYRLTGYKVNGLDSLDALNAYIDTNSTLQKIGDLKFEDNSFQDGSHGYTTSFSIKYLVKSNNSLSGYSYFYNYSKNRKFVYFRFSYLEDRTLLPIVIKKNIFIDEEPWEIIRLELGKITKLKKIINNLTYEIQFEPKK